MRNHDKKQIVVIGLGRFGASLARTVAQLGHEVVGVDRDQKAVDDAAEYLTQAIRVDATEEDALIEMGLRNFDIGVVAIGDDAKSSILVTLLLKRLGVKLVISKAQDDLHAEILAKVGADRVVQPERETAIRIAHGLTTPNLVDYLGVLPGYGIAKYEIPPDLAGKELGQLDLKGKFGLTTLLLRRGSEVIINPLRSEVLAPGSMLVLAGRDEQIEAMRTK